MKFPNTSHTRNRIPCVLIAFITILSHLFPRNSVGRCFSSTRSHDAETAAFPRLQEFEALGAWFDGVAKINSSKIPRSPNATIAIVGAGITGLAMALMLDSVGLHSWELLEASGRIGGRFRTKFVGNSSEWVEMGPMRIPHSVTYKSDNSTHLYTDHALVFGLANWLNGKNKNNSRWKIDFIPWVQHHPNELLAQGTRRHLDGSVPTRADILANSSLGRQPAMTSAEFNKTKSLMDSILRDESLLRSIQHDIWRTHKNVMDRGLDDWSQQSLMRHVLQADDNVTDAIWTATDYDVFWDEMVHVSNLALDGSRESLGETHWLCVDGGFDRLSNAFLPHVSDRLVLNRKIRKIETVRTAAGRRQTRLSWHQSSPAQVASKTYDYTILTPPFTMTRFIDLPKFSSVLGRAISEAGLRFKSACKVSLLFQERFWERGHHPIFGGYSMPASVPIGALYYPVYGFNESRPGLITHYRGGDWSDRFVSFSDAEHTGLVLDAVVSLHGERARDLYTGHFERLCWLQDKHTATAWARPDVAQHRLYIPSYHRTEQNIIFVGEHTAPTHAWISSALHSAVRGSVQLLLELGLVDEAKRVNKRWMGQWIKEGV